MDECTFCNSLTSISFAWRQHAVLDEPRFYDNYTSGKVLGRGNYAVVRKCRNKFDGGEFAVKIIKKARLSNEEKKALTEEIAILKSLDHPKVMKLFTKFEDHRTVYLVTELIAGGPLYDRLEAKKIYTEKESADTCREIFKAIQYCHDRNIVHRDIKPENILLTSRETDTCLKIADFGFATYVNGDNHTTLCGSPSYVAVEVVRRKPYGVKIDIWSIGVIVYTLLAGHLPFESDDLITLFRKIARGKYDFPEKEWSHISEDAKTLVKALLQVNPSKRFTAKEALLSKWILERDDVLASRNLKESQKRLQQLNSRKKLCGIIREVTIREFKNRAA